MKITYNACFGGFSLSEAAIYRYAELKGLTLYPEKEPTSGWLTTYWTVPPEERPATLEGDAWYRATTEQRKAYNEAYTKAVLYDRDIPRNDQDLARVVEELGPAANGAHASLVVVDLPAGTFYRITEYDGFEGIETSTDIDWSVAT